MNIVTYKQYPKTMNDIKIRLAESINSCQNESQLSAVLDFNSQYIASVAYFDALRTPVTDNIINQYFQKDCKN